MSIYTQSKIKKIYAGVTKVKKVFLGSTKIYSAIEKINLPTVSANPVYNGGSQSPMWSGYDSTKMTIGGTYSATNVGVYTATFTPKDGYAWDEEGTEIGTETVSWSITRATVAIPTVTGNFTYDGTEKYPQISGFDPTYMYKNGDESGHDAQTYRIFFDLIDTINCQWSDGSIFTQMKAWDINKAQSSITLEQYSMSMGQSDYVYNNIISCVGDGGLSAYSNKPDELYASMVGDSMVLVQSRSQYSTVTVYVEMEESMNYLPTSTSFTVTIEAQAIDVEITSDGSTDTDWMAYASYVKRYYTRVYARGIFKAMQGETLEIYGRAGTYDHEVYDKVVLRINGIKQSETTNVNSFTRLGFYVIPYSGVAKVYIGLVSGYSHALEETHIIELTTE